MKSPLLDTISAISTPHGHGGIGVVRLSGPESVWIAQKIFLRTGKDKEIRSHFVTHGYITDPESGEKVDEVLLTIMISPKTYTGEDTVEISCHGGFFNTNRILDLTLKAGARLAEPGEFTRRAFLNGRINLLQAEGVIDLISSKSKIAHDAAFKLLDNALFEKIEKLKKSLFAIAIELESEIDFSEEEIPTRGRVVWLEELKGVVRDIDILVKSYDRGKIAKNGIRVTIAGKPNVGKSSLMNSLLKEDRAIVSNIPGTTRDTIEESMSVNGISISLTDTAGLQQSDDIVEQEGIRRSRVVMEKSDMLLAVFDGSEEFNDYDFQFFKLISGRGDSLLLVANKADKKLVANLSAVGMGLGDYPLFSVSAKTGEGIENLVEGISSRILQSSGRSNGGDELLVTRKRQYDLLVRAGAALERTVALLEEGMFIDMLAEEVKAAISILEELTGDTYSEKILDRIFSEFCIGK